MYKRQAHYNHHLRPTAERDEALVRRYCRYREIPLTCGGGDVSAWARENGASLEDAARTLRYRFLEETADQVGAVRIATAHHVQDNAETVPVTYTHLDVYKRQAHTRSCSCRSR